MSRAKAYFFRESEYMRYDIVSNEVDVGATPIAREWSVQPGAMRWLDLKVSIALTRL